MFQESQGPSTVKVHRSSSQGGWSIRGDKTKDNVDWVCAWRHAQTTRLTPLAGIRDEIVDFDAFGSLLTEVGRSCR